MSTGRLGRALTLTLALLVLPAVALSKARGAPAEFVELQRQIADAPHWDRPRLERETWRREALILPEDRTPVDVVWRRTTALLQHLRALTPAPDLGAEAVSLAALAGEVTAARRLPPDAPEHEDLFTRLAGVRRRIAFRNPLLDFPAIFSSRALAVLPP